MNEGTQSPTAKLQDLQWLVGYRRGTAFGPSMTGTFKLLQDDQVNFYEILTITEENGSLTLKLKHFDSDLKGWEEKDRFLTFRLVRISADAVYFDGLTYIKREDGTLDAYVAMRQADGSIQESEVKFGQLISSLRE